LRPDCPGFPSRRRLVPGWWGPASASGPAPSRHQKETPVTTRLLFRIEAEGAGAITVDYDIEKRGLWVAQAGDRVWVAAAAVEDRRAALCDEADGVEIETRTTSLAATAGIGDSDSRCGSMRPGQGVTCRKAHGHTSNGVPFDRDHEGSDGTDDYVWEA